jgi:hypothetical protein
MLDPIIRPLAHSALSAARSCFASSLDTAHPAEIRLSRQVEEHLKACPRLRSWRTPHDVQSRRPLREIRTRFSSRPLPTPSARHRFALALPSSLRQNAFDSLVAFEVGEHDDLDEAEKRQQSLSVRGGRCGLTKKTEVKRRTALMTTAKRKSHASPDCVRAWCGGRRGRWERRRRSSSGGSARERGRARESAREERAGREG